MSGHPLLLGFDVVADSTSNIPLLRKLVVALAVKGRLVNEAWGTDAAAEVVRQIAVARSASTAAARRRGEPLHPIAPEELPGSLSAACHFERLADVAVLKKGLTAIQKAVPGGFPLVVTAEARATCAHFDFEGPATIVPMVSSAGHGKASMHRLHFQEGRFALGNILCAIFPFAETLTSSRFIYEYLTAFKDDLLVSRMVGTANVSLTLAKIGEVPVPIVSVAVQRRVNELMELCDRLESAQRERERGRDRLVVARLHDLHETDAPSVTRSRVDLLLTEMPRTTSKPQDMAHLRQAVTTLALRGRLSTQDPCDESALSFLAQLGKQVATSRGERGAEVPEDMAVPPEDCPHALPSGWAWARLAALFTSITDGDHQPPPRAEEGVAFLTIGNISSGGLDFGDCRIVSRSYYESLAPHRRPALGDILYTVVGATYGRPVLVDAERPFCVQRHIAILKPARGVNRSYLMRVLSSAAFYDQATRSITGAAQPTIPLRPLRRLLVPVPPLAEQRRIVARLDELISLCDRLEGQLALGQAEGTRLLRSVIQEALAEAS